VGRVRGPILILCLSALVAGCGDDDETTVIETTTVTTIETVPTTPAPDATAPTRPEEGDEAADGADDGAAEAPSKCGRIAFNPSTDSGAASIRASGTDCETAQAVARAARNATDELSYEAEGFRCAGTRSEKAGLSSIEWFCLGADREVVSFLTT
jgi:hypothetical protein